MKNILICFVSLVTVCSALDCTYNKTSINSTCDFIPLLGWNCSSCNEPLSNGTCNNSLTLKRFELCEGNMNITVCVQNCRNDLVFTDFANCSLNISTHYVTEAPPTQLTCEYVTKQTTTTINNTTTSSTTTTTAATTTTTAAAAPPNNSHATTENKPGTAASNTDEITTDTHVTISMNTTTNEPIVNATNGAQQQKGLSKTAVVAISASASAVGLVALVVIVICIIKKKKAGAVLPNDGDGDSVHAT